MVATSQALASEAAIAILRRGGHAIDAAVAAAAVLAVVEPQATGIGGDCFVLYVPGGSGDVIAYNGSGRAPMAAGCDWYRQQGFTAMPERGVHSVTVPGAIDAWCRLVEDHGRLTMAELLAPAIRYAAEGYVVGDRIATDWKACVPLLAADPAAARIFLPEGRAPSAGTRHRQPELAETLRAIAKKGRAGFYEGPVAADILACLKSGGGLHAAEDFAAAAGEYVEPIRTTYRGVEVAQIPPGNQGLTALILLNILGNFDLAGLDPVGAERLHLETEAARLAFRDRNRFIGDPRHVAVPVEALLSPDYARKLAALIDPAQAMVDLPPPLLNRSDTTYLCVVDRDRNAVSFINSIYRPFGSGVVAPESGIVLQNRGASFNLDSEHANGIAGGKRPMHTIMPGMALKGGRALMPFGVMGGDYQPVGQAHVLSNLLDFACDPQEAIDLPRVFHNGQAIEVERGVPPRAIAGLIARGHAVHAVDPPHGGGQMILIDHDAGTLTGASDPRKDGCALGY